MSSFIRIFDIDDNEILLNLNSITNITVIDDGYIYQACNFLYTGRTKPRTDRYAGKGKHSRHTENFDPDYRVVRSAKNRYVYFCTYKSRLKKEWMEHLNYPTMTYPKEENKNYILGEYQKQILVKV